VGGRDDGGFALDIEGRKGGGRNWQSCVAGLLDGKRISGRMAVVFISDVVVVVEDAHGGEAPGR